MPKRIRVLWNEVCRLKRERSGLRAEMTAIRLVGFISMNLQRAMPQEAFLLGLHESRSITSSTKELLFVLKIHGVVLRVERYQIRELAPAELPQNLFSAANSPEPISFCTASVTIQL